MPGPACRGGHRPACGGGRPRNPSAGADCVARAATSGERHLPQEPAAKVSEPALRQKRSSACRSAPREPPPAQPKGLGRVSPRARAGGQLANLQAKKNQLLMRQRAGVLQLVAPCRQRRGRGDVEGGDGDSRQRRGGPQPAGTLPNTGPVETLTHGRSPTRPPGRRTDSFVGNGARGAVCIHGQTIKATLCEPRGS